MLKKNYLATVLFELGSTLHWFIFQFFLTENKKIILHQSILQKEKKQLLSATLIPQNTSESLL